MTNTMPELDPAHIYRDRDGHKWEYLGGRWVIGGTHSRRVAAREIGPGFADLPAKYGPYTRWAPAQPPRIEDTK